jgi:hypothetical protein
MMHAVLLLTIDGSHQSIQEAQTLSFLEDSEMYQWSFIPSQAPDMQHLLAHPFIQNYFFVNVPPHHAHPYPLLMNA